MQDELKRLGFEKVGDFFIMNDELNFRLIDFQKDVGVYLFLIDEKIKYVGVTQGELQRRIYGYKNPGPSQRTNQRIKKKLLDQLQGMKTCTIWFMPENKIQELKVLLVRAKSQKEVLVDSKLLERLMITTFKPEWNLD